MAAAHQFLGDIRNDALRAAMQPRRDRLIQRCDLCDAQTVTTNVSAVNFARQFSFSRRMFGAPTVEIQLAPPRWRNQCYVYAITVPRRIPASTQYSKTDEIGNPN